MALLTREITMSPASKKQQVIDTIRARIASGEWPPGHRLPSRPVLMAEFGVSITTIRDALNYLQTLGELESVPSVGVYVPERTSR